jgi:hypothetical protein
VEYFEKSEEENVWKCGFNWNILHPEEKSKKEKRFDKRNRSNPAIGGNCG